MVTILGGGISGLATAYYLTKNGVQKVSIIEATNRVGGWIKCNYYPDIWFEEGPRTLRPKGIKGLSTLNLVEDIGLENRILPITSTHEAVRNRMIFANGQLCILPSNLKGLFATNPPFSKPIYRSLLTNLFFSKHSIKKTTDESIYSFAERNFGKEVAEYIISPMMCGICAGDAKEISVKFLLEDMFYLEQKHGRLIKGLFKNVMARTNKVKQNCGKLAQRSINEKWSIYSLYGGLEQLPYYLGRYLLNNGVEINLNSGCTEIQFEKANAKLTINGKQLETQCLVSSLPAFVLAETLLHQHPILAKELIEIPYADVAVINLHFNRSNLLKQTGFGVLVAPRENSSILGVIYDSCVLNTTSGTILTVMMGGRWFDQRFGTNPNKENLISIAVTELRRILKIDENPTRINASILRKCIPQYIIGHQSRIKRIEDYIKTHRLPLHLCGAPYNGIGINDVIYSAKQVANEISKQKLIPQ